MFVQHFFCSRFVSLNNFGEFPYKFPFVIKCTKRSGFACYVLRSAYGTAGACSFSAPAVICISHFFNTFQTSRNVIAMPIITPCNRVIQSCMSISGILKITRMNTRTTSNIVILVPILNKM